MIPYTPARSGMSLPVIDISGALSGDGARRRVVAGEVRMACRDTGFFYLAGHGVPDALTRGQLDAARRFFALPQAEKDALDHHRSAAMRGYERMQGQTLDVGSPPDLKESFMIGADPGPDHPFIRDKVPQYGPNQWPPDMPGFRDQTLAYADEMVRLGRGLMRLLALSLDLEETFFEPGLGTPMYAVRMLHYPPHPEQARPNQLGAGTHTDWGAITILLQDDVGGLEVRNAAGDWLAATPMPGAFVINLGDMVRRWTNDLYQSTPHRVLNNHSGRDRYSVATFFNPEYHTRVECVPSCRPAEGEPRHAPCTVGEHIDEMFRRTYADA